MTSPQHFFSKYESYQVSSFSKRHFPPEALYPVIQRLAANSQGVVTVKQVGESSERRSINMLTMATEPATILYWSQMHGDESTGRMAICALLKNVITTKKEKATQA